MTTKALKALMPWGVVLLAAQAVSAQDVPKAIGPPLPAQSYWQVPYPMGVASLPARAMAVSPRTAAPPAQLGMGHSGIIGIATPTSRVSLAGPGGHFRVTVADGSEQSADGREQIASTFQANDSESCTSCESAAIRRARECTSSPCYLLFGELLELRARDNRVAYAVVADSAFALPAAVQVGRIASVDQDWQAAFRVGGTYVQDGSSITASFIRFNGRQTDALNTAAPNVLRSLVRHPQGPSTLAAGDFLSATAQHDIDFYLIDADCRSTWHQCDYYTVWWSAGCRFAELNQQFGTRFQDGGFETVTTDIGFCGIGPRIGLEGERRFLSGFALFGKGTANFLVGDFSANFRQGGDADPLAVNTNWKGAQIVPVLDLELGLSWTSANERLRVSAGYLISAWFNTVKTEDWIHAVQNNSLLGLGETMTFDGLSARAEVRF